MRWWVGSVALIAAVALTGFLFLQRAEAPKPEAPLTQQPGDTTKPELALYPADALSEPQRQVLFGWIAKSKRYAVITRDHCGCAGEFEQGRSPYLVVSDMNGDGIDDFAVLLEDTVRVGLSGERGGPAILLIFNGPFAGSAHAPAYSGGEWRENDALFSGPGDAAVFVGPPESDDGYKIVPKGAGYEFEYQGDGG